MKRNVAGTRRLGPALIPWLLLLLHTPVLAAEIVECADPPTPATDPGAAVCAVEGSGSELLLVGDVLTPGVVYEGGGVRIDAGGTITCVGCECAGAPAATHVICPDAVVSPGLINAHDHVGWMHRAPWVASDEGVDPALRFEHRHDWRVGLREHPMVDPGAGNATLAEKTFGELRFVLGGATSTFGSGTTGGLLRNLDRDPGLGLAEAEYDTFPLGDASGSLLDGECGYPNPVVSIDPALGAYGPHVAEGVDTEARNEFLCLTGGRKDAVNPLDDRTALVHGIGLRAEDVQTMAERGMALIWSPRSNLSLYGDTASVTLMDALGVPIALGTDWIVSGSMNVLRELACADEFNATHLGGYFEDEALWRMATVGAAEALGADAAIGVLETGTTADVAVFEKSGRDAHRAILEAGPGEVALVLRAGRALSGNTAVVAALEAGCDEIGDVCGRDKRVCFAYAAGTTWAALQADVGMPAYPPFACDVPEDEPSCTPLRTLAPDSVDGSGLYDGTTAADDPDGDGLADTEDNCPDVFNPIRPVDLGVQADFDLDGVGDACDTTPVPEPGPWAMLAVGTTVLGLALRTRAASRARPSADRAAC